MRWIAHHRGKFRLYTDTSTQTINKIAITDFFAQYYINRIYLNYLDLHLKSKLFMAKLAQYKIPMHKELWCVVLDLLKIEPKNRFGGKTVISRIIILFNLYVFLLTIAHLKLKFTLFSMFTLFSILLYYEEFLILHTTGTSTLTLLNRLYGGIHFWTRVQLFLKQRQSESKLVTNKWPFISS